MSAPEVAFEPMSSTMPVSMMDVREMNVLVNHDVVPMRVGMRLVAIPRKIVRMLVMHVMAVSVIMVDCVVSVLMFVPLAEMQPKTRRHECSGDDQLHGDDVTE